MDEGDRVPGGAVLSWDTDSQVPAVQVGDDRGAPLTAARQRALDRLREFLVTPVLERDPGRDQA